ncbi:hypothetical protein [Saccharomonospora halophila]|uniref:hypothetical protein n=1 Tax=Saccharomonospora halophila TaxID=129922 RepID=UPI00036ECB8F|nr:hypothetical protein [Saccharomonospora halophila]
MNYTIWPARDDDLGTVMRLLHERVAWLRRRGSDQWSTHSRWLPEMEESLAQRRTWLLRDARTCVPLGTKGDPVFWTPAELREPAVYLAKLATTPAYAGLALGKLLLDFTLHFAATRGFSTVRMDVWRTFTDLHVYYRSHDWSQLPTVDLPHRHSGTLFEKGVTSRDETGLPRELDVRPHGRRMTRAPVILSELARYHSQ